MADQDKFTAAEAAEALPQLGGEPRQTVEVKFQVTAGLAELVLMDDVPLDRDAESGLWRARAGQGDYLLRWLADSGLDDEPYTLAVVGPECAAFKPPPLRTDKKGRARGLTTIRVCAPAAVLMSLWMAVHPATAQEGPLLTVPAPVAGATLRAVPAPTVYLTAATEEKRARIEAEVGKWSAGAGGFSRSHLVFSASAPLAEGEEPTILADLRGLGGATTASLALNGWVRDPVGRSADLQAWCLEARRHRRLPDTFQCGEVPGSILNPAKLSESMLAEHDVVAGGAFRFLWSIASEVGRETVNYLRADDFEPESEETMPWSVEGKFGTLVNAAGGVNLVSAGARWQQSFAVGAAADICTPVGTGGALRCRNRPIGAPAREREAVLDAQVRSFLTRRLAVNPHLSYGVNGGEIGIELPIYVVANSDGALIAGINPSWNSKTDRGRLSIFVGKAFDFGL
ncbi:MAG TPA: hypothetical protein VF647_08175 [Longimicrobium sp.]|jgi:hypothetical protein